MVQYNVPRPSSRRVFRPRAAPTVAVILLLPLLVSLGFWQLDRAEQKRDLLADFETGGTTVSVDELPDISALGALPRYQSILLRGRFDSRHQFLIDNITDGGAAGYYVLTPFEPQGASTWVLVNRGWVRKDFGTAILPDVAVPETQRSIRGRVARLPRPGLELEDRSTTTGWPRVVQFPTMAELSAVLGRDLAPVSVLLAPEAEDGYLRRWRPDGFGPKTHIGYAVQWFALALTLAIIYVVVNRRRRSDD